MRIISVPPEQRLAFLQRHPCFQGMPTESMARLVEALHLRTYEAGEALFWEAEPCAGMFILRKGAVKLFRVSPQGREIILRVLEPEETFNEVSVFDGGANPVNVMAVQPCEVWCLPVEPFQAELRRSPALAQNVIRSLCRRSRYLVQMVEELSLYRVTCRLARLVMKLGPEELHGPRRMTQDEIAARLGTVREVVARSLRELQNAGALTVRRGRIYVRDETVLSEWAMISEG